MMNYFLIYLAAVNVLAFCMFVQDKRKARNRQWRISEGTLLFLAVIGGSAGAWVAMSSFRHKTRKAKFAVGIPVILAVQVLAIAAFYLI